MDYLIIKTGEGPGIDGGLGKEKNPSVNTIDVPDVDEYLERIIDRSSLSHQEATLYV